ncbi:hypothetical protein [Streptomyces sp. PanSC9]|uniref:hypothetical protein n=1 Tax=Streptomyces sp. PanSC9 TaxID=1520461 RepID=UPI0011CE34AE|nr:hypothetical protein [Streptomyces sp. PanSC9]
MGVVEAGGQTAPEPVEHDVWHDLEFREFLQTAEAGVGELERAGPNPPTVRHGQVVILSLGTEPVPRVPVDRRLVVDDLGYAVDGVIDRT